MVGYLPRWWDDRFDVLWDRVVDGRLQSIRGLALAGNDVIAPTMILPGTAETHFRLFSDFTVYLVAIRCPIEVAQHRELRRSDRRRPLDLTDLGMYAWSMTILVATSRSTRPGSAPSRGRPASSVFSRRKPPGRLQASAFPRRVENELTSGRPL